MTLITEATPPFKHGSSQLEFSAACTDKLQDAVHKGLKGNELAPEGPEFDTHLTVRGGVDHFEPLKIKGLIRDFEPITIKIIDIDCFPDTKDGSAVFFKVEPSEELLRLRQTIEDNCECCEPAFPDYKPHITIAYVKKEMWEEVVKNLREMYTFPFEVIADNFMISEASGKQYNYPLHKNYAAHKIAHLIKNHLDA